LPVEYAHAARSGATRKCHAIIVSGEAPPPNANGLGMMSSFLRIADLSLDNQLMRLLWMLFDKG